MAMLDGYLNRKHDPALGHKNIWTGYNTMIHYTNTYLLYERSDPEYSYADLLSDKRCG